MSKTVTVTKPFRHCLRVFEIGEVGEIVEVEHPFTFIGRPMWDFYVKFVGHEPVGVHESEVKRNEH